MSRSGAREPGFIYIVRPVNFAGPVKIGFSQSPEGRLRTLAAWSPFPLEIIAQFPGTFALEQNLHECLAASHSHHEWFLPTAKVLAFVDAILAGRPVERAIDLTAREGRAPRKPWSPEARMRATFTHRLRRLKDVPADLQPILNRWFGGQPPSAVEMRRLEEALPHRGTIRPLFLVNAEAGS